MNTKPSISLNPYLIILLVLTLSVFSSSVSAQIKKLTIENNSVLPLRVFVDSREGSPSISIGYVEPTSIKTFDFPLQIGRWYVTINPYYKPNDYMKDLRFTLYVKEDKDAYIYEIMDKDFRSSPILPPYNVSIIGTWASESGLATSFKKEGDEFVGTIVSCPEGYSKIGYFAGMEWIRVRRTNHDAYKGTWIKFGRNGSTMNTTFHGKIEKGNKMFPYDWIKR